MGHGATPGSREAPIPRRAARVLLVDGADRLLLLHGFDPTDPGSGYWFTAGGGLDPGESAADGAIRELREETGLEVSRNELGDPVFYETADIPFDGLWYRQEQDFFLVRVISWDVSMAGLDEQERQTIDDYRWWPLAELTGTSERVYPLGLATLMRGIVGP